MALSNGNSPGTTTTTTTMTAGMQTSGSYGTEDQRKKRRMETTTMSTTMTAGMQRSGSYGADFGQCMDQRKKRRMESNRESARRSRMRKQMHLDELAATATCLASENARLSAGITVAAQRLMAVESENMVLRAQMAELSRRLDSLDDILRWVEPGSAQVPDWFGNWNPTGNNLPIAAASHDLFRYLI